MRLLIVALAVAALAPSASQFELVQPELFAAPGAHPLYRNVLSAARAKQSVEVRVVDERGRDTRAGSEVRVYAAGTRKLLGVGVVDTGSGYCSQNVMPVHVGLGSTGRVDIEVTSMSKSGRIVTRSTRVTPGRGVVGVRPR